MYLRRTLLLLLALPVLGLAQAPTLQGPTTISGPLTIPATGSLVVQPGASVTLPDNALQIGDTAGLQTALDARQPLDSDLTAIAALTTTAHGRGLLDDANAAASRASLGLGSLATASTVTAAQISDASAKGRTLIQSADVEPLTAAEKTKLAGIAAGATANSTDAQLRDRATHTGTQSAATITGLATVATSGSYADLSNRPTLGTAAALNVAATGNAAVGEVVRGNDTRLTDARTPLAHNQAWSTITSTPTTLAGYGITDGLTNAFAQEPGSNINFNAALWRSQLGLAASATTDTTNATNITSGTLVAARLPLTGVSAGTYRSLTVDTTGRVTAGTNPTTLAGYGITDGITAATAASTYQPLDSDLTAIAALTTTAHGRGLLDDADAAASRASLGLGSLATASTVTAAQISDASAKGRTLIQSADVEPLTAAEKTKLAGIAAGATANATDAQLRDRATHTGTQSAATITGLATVATSGSASDLGAGTLADARLSANVPLRNAANTYTNAAQIAPSWRLPAYAGAETLPVGTSGMGWDELGRFTLQTPVGAFQVYSVGSPAVPTLYWPGTIVSQRSESLSSSTVLPASNISAGAGGEAINFTVMRNSLVGGGSQISQWLNTTAEPAGMPTQSDTHAVSGSLEFVDGVYWPQALVENSTTQTSTVAGRYRTATQMRGDLGQLTATAALDFPSIAAAAQADLTITLTGAAVGDAIYLGLPAAPAAGLVFNAFVSAANTVTVRASNITVSAVDAASATYRVTRF